MHGSTNAPTRRSRNRSNCSPPECRRAPDAQLALFGDIDVRADLARIAVPVLVVSPLGDLLITPVHSRELAEGIPGARLATLDCGHANASKGPAEWAELITKFLAAVDD
ncbi:alpha/beta hydrolase [Streptomyces sp. NPDC023838]|uniref:alpha/beta fold hydrolase n=1 Tax=Streptomyces sp. NPDC023838 TaxID=3154325 RepID=UPI0033D595BC